MFKAKEKRKDLEFCLNHYLVLTLVETISNPHKSFLRKGMDWIGLNLWVSLQSVQQDLEVNIRDGTANVCCM